MFSDQFFGRKIESGKWKVQPQGKEGKKGKKPSSGLGEKKSNVKVQPQGLKGKSEKPASGLGKEVVKKVKEKKQPQGLGRGKCSRRRGRSLIERQKWLLRPGAEC